MDLHGEEGAELLLFNQSNGDLVSAGEEARLSVLRVSVDRATLPGCA